VDDDEVTARRRRIDNVAAVQVRLLSLLFLFHSSTLLGVNYPRSTLYFLRISHSPCPRTSSSVQWANQPMARPCRPGARTLSQGLWAAPTVSPRTRPRRRYIFRKVVWTLCPPGDSVLLRGTWAPILPYSFLLPQSIAIARPIRVVCRVLVLVSRADPAPLSGS
jgi:hypothetical protein